MSESVGTVRSADRSLSCPRPTRTAQRTASVHQSTHITTANTVVYRSSQMDCARCSLKDQCYPNTPIRKIARSVHELARDKARAIKKTPAYRQSRKDRKQVEILFAHLKLVMELDRLRLRGPSGTHDEFLLVATAHYLRRMAKWLMPKQEEAAAAAASNASRSNAQMRGDRKERWARRLHAQPCAPWAKTRFSNEIHPTQRSPKAT